MCHPHAFHMLLMIAVATISACPAAHVPCQSDVVGGGMTLLLLHGTQVLGPKAAAYVLGARNAPGVVARALSRCLIKAVRAPSPVPFWVAQRCEDIITGPSLAAPHLCNPCHSASCACQGSHA